MGLIIDHLADGCPIPAATAIFGQDLTSTTRKMYAHALPGVDRLAAEAMERLL